MGKVRTLATDDLGRVYIPDGSKFTVHVFHPDGHYMTNIGREGSGPGEFRSPPFPIIHLDQLYLFDVLQFKIAVFCLDSFDYIRTIQFRGNWDTFPALVEIRNDGKFLVNTMERLYIDPDHPRYNLEENRFVRYYLVDDDGISRQTNPVLKQRATEFLIAIDGGRINRATNLMFQPKALVAVSNDDDFYSVPWSEFFLIKIYSPEGEYKRSIYYHFGNKALARQDAAELEPHEGRRRLIEIADLPETWPALDEILIDDENRIWVSTVYTDLELFEWWILSNDGDLLATFRLPRGQTIEEVRNGKVYIRETDEMGISVFVRYRIEMDESDK